MKTYLKFAAIPLGLFTVFFALPRLVATLLNSHTDVGLLAILVLVCGISGWIAKAYHNVTVKETENHE